MHKCIAIVIVATMGYSTCIAAQSVEPEPSKFSYNGFGTLGVTHSSEDQADFVGGIFQPNGAGFTHPWSMGVDSKLGLQVEASLSDRFSATIQVASQHQYDNSWTPQLEWANVKYQITPDFSVRIGRTVLSTLMVSDSGLVSYSQPWVRPPLEVYGQIPIHRKDGIDAMYRFHAGEVTNSVKVSYGQYSANLAQVGHTRAKRFFDITETAEYGPWTVRLGYTSLLLDVDVPQVATLFDGFTQLGNVLATIPGQEAASSRAFALVQQYKPESQPYSVINAGGSYDSGAWLLMAEWVKVNSSGVVSSPTGWYVTGGYRSGKFTPYLTLARMATASRTVSGIPLAGLPPPLAAAASQLNGGLAATVTSFTRSQKTSMVGVRWDFRPSTALKLQYERLNTLGSSSGLLSNVQPGFEPGRNIQLFSASIDFVF